MKQFIIAVVLCVSTLGIAQTTTSQRTITVYGSVVKPVNNISYKIDVTLTMDNGYYDESQYKTLAELITKYYEKLKNDKIDVSKFTRDDLAYAASGFRKEGTILRFITKDKNEILKFINVKMAQVTPSYVQVKSEVSDADIKILTKKAIEDARKNAEVVAESAGEEIDELYSINSSYTSGYNTYWNSPSSNPEYFSVTVVYSLKDK